MPATLHQNPLADVAPERDDTAPPPMPPRAQQARRRALLAIGGITALLVLLWFGDALSGLVPRGAYRTTTHQAGSYHATLSITPTQPKAGAPLHAMLHLTDGANHPITGATITYSWAMVTMDMGTTHGTASADATAGTYDATLTGFMGGYWRLTAHLHAANLPDATVTFDVPIQG